MSDILLQQKTDDGILILTLNRPDAMNCSTSTCCPYWRTSSARPTSI